VKSALERKRNQLAAGVVLGLLRRMRMGRLDLTLPDGTREHVGTGQAEFCADLQIDDDEFFWRCILFGDIGLAESYMDGLCRTSSVASLIAWFLYNHEQSPVLNESGNASRLFNLFQLINKFIHASRRNSQANSKSNIKEHYDLGNDFFALFLDNSMTYSSGLFTDRSMSLEGAQKAKIERAVTQLQIKPSDRVLDLGCGWGALSLYIARNIGAKVTAVTISRQQFDAFQQLIAKERLEHLIDLRLEDYRNLSGKYDKIVSIEMIEAIGDEYMDVFVRKLDQLLDKDGLLLMQMITSPDSHYDVLKANVDFIQKHIFPGSLLPSLHRVSQAMVRSGDLFMVDLFDMTSSYVVTLKRWQDAFEANLPAVRSMGFDERFIRKWIYYFQYCQAAFHTRNISVVQAMYSRPHNRKLSGEMRSWISQPSNF
jgi:cyclopropane-fatty-acyl-phospholipid synthase